MNNLKWLIRLVLGLLIVGTLSWQAYKLFYWLSSAKPLLQKQGEETRSTVHWLESDRPLTYTFSPSQAIEIRILSNAILSAEHPLDSSAHYAIQYELWDDNQQLLSGDRYHHAARFVADKDQLTKQIMENRETLHVSSGQSFYLRQHVFNNANKLVLNLVTEDPSIKGVVVRLHAKTKTNEPDIQRTWQKYPVTWRDRISQYHTLGPYALSESEIANAVQYDWQKLAPLGIPEVDFVQGTLYESLPYHVASYDFSSEQLSTDAFLSSNTLTASVNVYQQQDFYFSTEAHLDALKLTWYDPKKFAAPKTLTAEHTQVANQYKLNQIKPGLIVIESTSPVLSSWYNQDLQPLFALHSLYYQTHEQNTVQYAVQPHSDLKLDIKGAPNTQATIRLLDEQGLVVKTFHLALNATPSHYERAINSDTTRSTVYDSEIFYLRSLPDAVTQIDIATDKSSAIRLQARNEHFNYQTTYCEQLCDPEAEDFLYIPAWFVQKASNAQAFSQPENILKVRSFSAPPEEKTSQTHYRSALLFAALPLSNIALVNEPKRYDTQHVPPEDFQFRIVTDRANLAKNQTSATAIIVKNQKFPFTREYSAEQFFAFAQTQRLANDTQVFINQGDERPWSKQRLYFMKKNEPLSLPYSTTPKSIIIKAFSTQQQTPPVVVSAKLDAFRQPSLAQEYTLLKRRVALKVSEKTNAFMLHPNIGHLQAYTTMTIPIGHDISQLNQLILKSEQDIWLSILNEYEHPTPELKWWSDES